MDVFSQNRDLIIYDAEDCFLRYEIIGALQIWGEGDIRIRKLYDNKVYRDIYSILEEMISKQLKLFISEGVTVIFLPVRLQRPRHKNFKMLSLPVLS